MPCTWLEGWLGKGKVWASSLSTWYDGLWGWALLGIITDLFLQRGNHSQPLLSSTRNPRGTKEQVYMGTERVVFQPFSDEKKNKYDKQSDTNLHREQWGSGFGCIGCILPDPDPPVIADSNTQIRLKMLHFYKVGLDPHLISCRLGFESFCQIHINVMLRPNRIVEDSSIVKIKTSATFVLCSTVSIEYIPIPPYRSVCGKEKESKDDQIQTSSQFSAWRWQNFRI